MFNKQKKNAHTGEKKGGKEEKERGRLGEAL